MSPGVRYLCRLEFYFLKLFFNFFSLLVGVGGVSSLSGGNSVAESRELRRQPRCIVALF